MIALSLGLLALAPLAQEPAPRSEPKPQIQEHRRFRLGRIEASQAPRIDGDLGDACWRDAPELGPLVQVEPIAGRAPGQKTVVKILHDRVNLYFYFLCFDSEPKKIRASLRARDARMDPDDRIEWVIDTSGTRTQGYFFQIGAGGSRGDSLLGSSSFNKDWDTIWDAKTRVTSAGWQAEIVIPFRSLAFPKGTHEWGFNLLRNRRATNEEYRWTNIDQGQRFGRLSNLGVMEGIGEVSTGVGLDIVPFTSFKESRQRLTDDRWKRDPDLGGEIFYRLTPSLTASMTFFTDFAETENDQRQINLTRFPLFFPEKRDFFLEDSSRFNFGPIRRGRADFLPFFSRRIGLGPDGGAVPIITGAKVTGQQGPWEIGFLDVFMDKGGGVDSEKNLGVLRVNRSIGKETTIGFIGTRGRPSESGQNLLSGFDFYHREPHFIGDQDLRIWAFGAVSQTSGKGGDGDIVGLEAQGRGREWQWDLGSRFVSKDFNPELGFLRQSGIKDFRTNLQYEPRLESDTYRNLRFRVETRTVLSEGNVLDQAQYTFTPFGFRAHSGDRLNFEIQRNFDRIDETFDVFGSNEVPIASYWMTRYALNTQTSEGRPLNLNLRSSYGDFFQGTSWRFNGRGDWRVSPLLTVGGTYQITKARLGPNEDFTARVVEGNIDIHFTPDLSLFNLVQFDNDSSVLGVQSRLRWIIEPGSELFLVATNGWVKGADDKFRPDTQAFTMKLSHTLRF